MSTEAGQAARDIGINVTAGVAGAGVIGFLIWARKLVSLPKRVKRLEATDAVVLRSLGALTKYTLASNQHRRGSDTSPAMVKAEALLADADRELDRHLTNATAGVSE